MSEVAIMSAAHSNESLIQDMQVGTVVSFGAQIHSCNHCRRVRGTASAGKLLLVTSQPAQRGHVMAGNRPAVYQL